MNKDHIDLELLAVFLEEGNDLFPQIADALHKIKQGTSDAHVIQSLLRSLHTLKGSARMTGAIQLGDGAHDLETHIDVLLKQGHITHADIKDLYTHYDRMLALFYALQDGRNTSIAVDSPAAVHRESVLASRDNKEPLPTAQARTDVQREFSKKTVKKNKKNEVQTPMVRIHARLLEHFLNQTGEISIVRSHIATEVDHLKKMMTELGENIAHLEKHVRDVALQSEIQMQGVPHKESEETYFDALEFDRFTQLQERTQMMAETMRDVGALHKNLGAIVRDVRENSAKQARLIRALQDGVMSARMVQFRSVQERLQRLIRQVAREADKEVVLEVMGDTVEIDRSVLEKMTVVLEHLLRNAIVHGIEHRLMRLEAAKPAVGILRITLTQVGAEIVVQVADDGRGLDVARIHAQAVRNGLIAEETPLSHEDILTYITHPGLSTSEDVTALAGRGVGMDVVRAEVAALGGRISVQTNAGLGTTFVIHLPLRLAVTQVVLVLVEGKQYAIPAVLIDTVIRATEVGMSGLMHKKSYVVHDKALPVVAMSTLLRLDAQHPAGSTPTPCALVLGNTQPALVLLVDGVVGNKEVVIKNMGTQLAHVKGLLGVTMMGTGEIVLMMNPALLMRAYHSSAPVAPYMQGEGEVGASRSALPSTQAHLVLVVDDSFTVRRVTQKMLVRAGYRVLLAKDGMEALAQLSVHRPDIVLMDIEMPRMNGFDLLAQIKGAPDTREIPVVMITSRTAHKHRARAMALGADGYQGKPYQELALLALIKQLLP